MTNDGRSGESPENGNLKMSTNIDDKHPENCNCENCLHKSLMDYFRTGIAGGMLAPAAQQKEAQQDERAEYTVIVNTGQFMDFGPMNGVKK